MSVLALAPLAVAANAGINHAVQNDWNRQAALIANDLPGLLGYHPTDGASYSGAVRRAMDPANVQPR